MEYVALEVKTSYSMLESLNDITKLVQRAKTLNYKYLAITDNNNMFGVPSFYHECIKNDIKPIIGITLDIDNYKVILYAKNDLGYKNLIKLSTIITERNININDLEEYKDNLVLVMPYKYYDKSIYDIYDTKYVGYSNILEKEKINDKKVLINDVSYLEENDYIYLDYAKMIKDGKVLGEYELKKDKGKHLLSYEEVIKISDEEDIKNTLDIALMCNVELGFTPNLFPSYDNNINDYDYLSKICMKGLNKRLNGEVQEVYLNRLNYELDVINKMGFCNYFLIVWDYVKYAKKNNILVGPGRGSAAGSLVSYVLGITDIDPIKYNLLFERFLNPERVTMPDIDVDFDALKRDEVIDYVRQKYGNKRVVSIIAFNTLASKQVIRDVARVLKIRPSIIDNMTKLIGDDLKTSLENGKLQNMLQSKELANLYKICMKLEGLPRHVTVHAAGVVIANTSIDNVIPLYKNETGNYLTGYSKEYLEELGLLKMDFLSIKNLTIIDEVINNIRNNEGLNITFANIPIDNDKRVMEIFKTANTDGIFQFESGGMRHFLRNLKPDTFDDLIAALALFRPGPMDNIDSYIRRKEGKEKIDYIDVSLEEILKSTYGIIIYQEQIMQIANKMANYSLGEADILRKAVSKKNEDILLSEKDKFIKKSVLNGYAEEVSEKVYELILKFANYGFNKSHSVSYAIVAYKMAFLKTYFYSYFMSALLNNVVGSEIKTKDYLLQLKNRGVNIIMPLINRSEKKYKASSDGLILPLSIVKNVGVITINEIIKERNIREFSSFIDFVVRMKKIVNKKIITNLIYAGCFREFYNKKTLILNLDNIYNYADLVDVNSIISVEEPIIKEYDEYSNMELIDKENLAIGFYMSTHPVSSYKDINDISINDVPNYYDSLVNIKLYIDKVNEIVTKNNDVMAFVYATDESGEITLTVFKNQYEMYKRLLVKGNIVLIKGLVQRRYDKYQIVLRSMQVLNK